LNRQHDGAIIKLERGVAFLRHRIVILGCHFLVEPLPPVSLASCVLFLGVDGGKKSSIMCVPLTIYGCETNRSVDYYYLGVDLVTQQKYRTISLRK
jgi:hypothetical protein